MSKKQVNIQIEVGNLKSDQEFTVDPDRVLVTISGELLDMAEKCISFMSSTGACNIAVRQFAMGYDFWQRADTCFDEELAGKSVIEGQGGVKYVEYTPDFKIEGCHARIHSDGDIYMSMPLENIGGEVSGRIGSLSELKVKLAEAQAAASA